MTLLIKIEDDQAKLMRDNIQIGLIELDRDHQVVRVVVFNTALYTESEKIIRLAASHVTRYIVNRTIQPGSKQGFSRLPGMTPELSARLLDFDAIAPEHMRTPSVKLESLMRSFGVIIEFA